MSYSNFAELKFQSAFSPKVISSMVTVIEYLQSFPSTSLVFPGIRVHILLRLINTGILPVAYFFCFRLNAKANPTKSYPYPTVPLPALCRAILRENLPGPHCICRASFYAVPPTIPPDGIEGCKTRPCHRVMHSHSCCGFRRYHHP